MNAQSPDAFDTSLAECLPYIDPDAARMLNVLYDAGAAMPLEWDDRPSALRWTFDEQHLWCDGIYRFRLGTHSGWLGLDALAHDFLLGAERDADGVPTEIRYLLLADRLHSLVEKVEAGLRMRFEWTPDANEEAMATPYRPDPSRAAFFRLGVKGLPNTLAGCIQFDEPVAWEKPLLEAPSAPGRPISQLDRLRLPLTAGIGTCTLGIREMRAIEVGDVVRIENQTARWPLTVPLFIGMPDSAQLMAQVDGATITVVSWRNPEMVTTPSSADGSEEADALAARLEHLDNLQVQLRFELSGLALSLREVRGIQPGHVFELDESVTNATLRIVAHGNVLGRGQLVAVGDVLGVRVIEFTPGQDG